MKKEENKIDKVVGNALGNYEADSASDWNTFSKKYTSARVRHKSGLEFFSGKGLLGIVVTAGLLTGAYHSTSYDTVHKMQTMKKEEPLITKSVEIIVSKQAAGPGIKNETKQVSNTTFPQKVMNTPEQEKTEMTKESSNKSIGQKKERMTIAVNNNRVHEIFHDHSKSTPILQSEANEEPRSRTSENSAQPMTVMPEQKEESPDNRKNLEILSGAGLVPNALPYEEKNIVPFTSDRYLKKETLLEASTMDSSETNNNNKKNSKWILGLSTSIDRVEDLYGWYAFETPDGDFHFTSHYTDYYGYSAGLQIKRILSEKWILRTGINVLFSGYSSSGSFTDTNNSFSISYSYEPKYLNVPITLGYFFINKKFKACAYLGISERVFIGDNSNRLSPSGAAYYKNFSFNDEKLFEDMHLSMEINYPLSKHFSLSIEPTLRRSIGTSNPFPGRYSSYTLAAGFYCRF